MKTYIGALALGLGLVGCGEQAPPDANPGPVQRLAVQPGPVASAGQVGSAANPSPVVVSSNNSAAGNAARNPAQDSGEAEVVAKINGTPIMMRELVGPLIESHGLPLLLNIVQLDLVEQQAAAEHVTVSPEDIRREAEITLEKLFKDADQKEQDQLEDAERKGLTQRVQQLREQIGKDREQLLAEYLNNQHYSRFEYDLVIKINAYLRKAAEPLVKGKVTDAMVEKEFGVEYGETRQVRYIQLANLQEVAEARRQLQQGADFAAVARDLSRNRQTAALGGEMPAFSRETPGLPQTFKDLAFSLEVGQVSDTLNVNGNFYILKLEKKFAPKAVKFDSVKESLRRNMNERLTTAVMEQLRTALGQKALTSLEVKDPTLAKQFDELRSKRDAAIKDREKIDEQWKKERDAATQPSAGSTAAPAPTTAPVPAVAPAPAVHPELKDAQP